MNTRVVVFDQKKGKRTYIESPDNLFRVGIDVDQDTLQKLGLSRYLSIPLSMQEGTLSLRWMY